MKIGQKLRVLVSYVLFLGAVVLAVQFSYVLFIEARPRLSLPDVIMRFGLILLIFFVSNRLHRPSQGAETADDTATSA